MDEYTKQWIMTMLNIISPEELEYRASRAKNDDDRRLWHTLYLLKQQQHTVRQ